MRYSKIISMQKHVIKSVNYRRWFRSSVVVRLIVLAGLVAIGASGFNQQGEVAHAVQSPSDYCGQYEGAKESACNDGLRGKACSDYAIAFDQATANVCTKAAQAKADGLVSDATNGSTSPTPNTSSDSSGSDDPEAYKNAVLVACAPYQNDDAAALWCLYGGLGQNGTANKPVSISDCISKPELQGSSINQNACIAGSTAGNTYLAIEKNNAGSDKANDQNALKDLLDQTQNLSQFISVLHAAGPNADIDTSKIPDNNANFYINGAGNQQPIIVHPSGKDDAPAIVWFNGGGWHTDDGTAYCLATGSPQKNCMAGADGGGDTGVGDMGPPPGGGANARGYTVIEVTYRLGSSGVYYMFEDVMRGLKHVIDNAGLYHIDPTKITVGGDSAGGSLAMRAVASGKSGVAVGVGWSAPTNAFTALFKSFQSFLIGMDHSTCIPTDLAGMTNFTDLLNGGSGEVAEYGQGLSSNDFTSFQNLMGGGGDNGGGGGNPLGIITQVLTAAQYAADTGQNVEAISKQIEQAYNDGNPSIQSVLSTKLPSGVFNLGSKKLVECIDNFKALSPALFAAPNTPPVYMVEFDIDDVVDPQQAYDMRDAVIGLGGKADALILHGDPNSTHGLVDVTTNHLGYDPRAVCPTLNFIAEVVGEPTVDCDHASLPPLPDGSLPGGGGGGDSSGGNSNGSGGNGNGSSSSGCPSGYLPAGGTIDERTGKATTKCVIDTSQSTGCPSGYLNAGGTIDGNGKYTSKCIINDAQSTCEQGGGSWADHRGSGNSSCSYNGSPNACASWWSQGCGGSNNSLPKVNSGQDPGYWDEPACYWGC